MWNATPFCEPVFVGKRLTEPQQKVRRDGELEFSHEDWREYSEAECKKLSSINERQNNANN
jgi:hypothetical protein